MRRITTPLCACLLAATSLLTLPAGDATPVDPWDDGNGAVLGPAKTPAAAGQAPTAETPPPPAKERVPGKLQGTVKPFALVKKIFAVDRSLTQAFLQNTVKTIEIEATLDAKTESYALDHLPEGNYDLRLELHDGRIIEGCDIRPAGTSVDPLTYDDRQKIRKVFAAIRHFTAENTLWRIEGNGQFATGLVELVRRNQTSLHEKVDGDKFVIWRVELWQFTKRGEAWEHTSSQVLRRMRPSEKDFATWDIEFAPSFGALKIEPHRTKLVDLTIPKVSDIQSGRYSREYLREHKQDGPNLHAGIECQVLLIDPETGTIVVDAGAAKYATKAMELWLYNDKSEVIAKGPVTRVAESQTTAKIPGLQARLPEIDPDDPYDAQGEAKIPEALKGLRVGSKARLVPLPE